MAADKKSEQASDQPATITEQEQETGMPARFRTPDAAPRATATDVVEAMEPLEVEQRAPMWWMKSGHTGDLFPAFDLGGRVELEGAGCAVTDEKPKGAPDATGPGAP